MGDSSHVQDFLLGQPKFRDLPQLAILNKGCGMEILFDQSFDSNSSPPNPKYLRRTSYTNCSTSSVFNLARWTFFSSVTSDSWYD